MATPAPRDTAIDGVIERSRLKCFLETDLRRELDIVEDIMHIEPKEMAAIEMAIVRTVAEFFDSYTAPGT